MDAGRGFVWAKRAVGPLHAPLGLGTVGEDRLDIQRAQGPRELRQSAVALALIDPENAVLVRVKRHRATVRVEVLAQRLHVRLGALRGHESP